MTDPAPPKTFPSIQGRCPACRGDSLSIGRRGYVICSRDGCPDPTAVDKLLHGEHVTAATPLICSDERHATKVAALQADLDRHEEVLGNLNETLVDRAKQAARAEAAIERVREVALWTRRNYPGLTHVNERLAAALDQPAPAATQATDHHYLSTGCLHGDRVWTDGRTGHQYCQSDTGKAGAKQPSQCKFCAAPCQCACHKEQPRV